MASPPPLEHKVRTASFRNLGPCLRKILETLLEWESSLSMPNLDKIRYSCHVGHPPMFSVLPILLIQLFLVYFPTQEVKEPNKNVLFSLTVLFLN